MAKQRYVRTNFRTDSYIEILSPDEKLIFLYLLTNESTNLCGIYEISLKRIAFETGVKLESVVSIIDKFSEDKRIFHIE
jgi:DNA-binding MarR family transcriptional regulator